MIDKIRLKRWWLRLFPEKDKPYYTSCRELPLNKFIWCLVKGDVWYLMKPKKPRVSKKVLEPVWNEIFYEYMDMVKDPLHTKMLILMKEITRLDTHYVLVYETCRQLNLHYYKPLVESLQKLGYRYKYDPSDRKQYRKELDLTISQTKSYRVKSEQYRKDLEEIRSDKGKKTEGADYVALLAELSKFQGYRIDPDVVTVAEFVAISNRYKKHVEMINKQHSNGKFRKN